MTRPLFLSTLAFLFSLTLSAWLYSPADIVEQQPSVATPTEQRDAIATVAVSSFPLSGRDFQAVTSPFGWRTHPITRARRFHSGLDLAAPGGSPVHAWVSGVVLDVRESPGGCGTEIWIGSGDWDSRYCHGVVGSVTVRRGERVQAGQVIMRVGMTGSATGNHLHWEARYRQQLINPGKVIEAEMKRRNHG